MRTINENRLLPTKVKGEIVEDNRGNIYRTASSSSLLWKVDYLISCSYIVNKTVVGDVDVKVLRASIGTSNA
jgi:hypothetical protein